MGASSRSTVGIATDVNAMLRILFSRLGEPHVGSPKAFPGYSADGWYVKMFAASNMRRIASSV